MKVLLIYELAQVDEVSRYIRTSADPVRLIALDRWVEHELEKRGIAFESFTRWNLGEAERDQLLRRSQEIAREWYCLPELSFFVHRGIYLAEASEPALDAYIQSVLYFFVPLKRIFDGLERSSTVIVPHSRMEIPAAGGVFAEFEITRVSAIVHFIATKKNYSVEELGTYPQGSVEPFPRQAFSTRLFPLWNFFLKAFVRPRPLKVFASETWAHIAPFITHMHNVELVLMDRSEAKNIPLRQILRYRVRFIHPTSLKSRSLRQIADQKRTDYTHAWKEARNTVARMTNFEHEGASWWPLIAPAFDFLVEKYSERLVYDTEALLNIYKKERVQKVLLRASMSSHQHHFFIAAKAAATIGIPSIELQHAGAVIDPDNPQSRLEASYLAGYGTLTRDMHIKNHGYAPERIRAVGSPRFDRYIDKPQLTEEEHRDNLQKIGLDPARPVALFAVTPDIPWLLPYAFDSYENAEIFRALAELKKRIPGLQFIFKFRSRNYFEHHRSYFAELFDNKDIAVVEDDLYYRMQMSDLIFSSDSTAFYEAMIAKRPLILFPWKKTDLAAIKVYSGAAPIVFDSKNLADTTRKIIDDISYRKELVERSNAFLKRNYAFDGHASDRMIKLLREDLKPFT